MDIHDLEKTFNSNVNFGRLDGIVNHLVEIDGQLRFIQEMEVISRDGVVSLKIRTISTLDLR